MKVPNWKRSNCHKKHKHTVANCNGQKTTANYLFASEEIRFGTSRNWFLLNIRLEKVKHLWTQASRTLGHKLPSAQKIIKNIWIISHSGCWLFICFWEEHSRTKNKLNKGYENLEHCFKFSHIVLILRNQNDQNMLINDQMTLINMATLF